MISIILVRQREKRQEREREIPSVIEFHEKYILSSLSDRTIGGFIVF